MQNIDEIMHRTLKAQMPHLVGTLEEIIAKGGSRRAALAIIDRQTAQLGPYSVLRAALEGEVEYLFEGAANGD